MRLPYYAAFFAVSLTVLLPACSDSNSKGDQPDNTVDAGSGDAGSGDAGSGDVSASCVAATEHSDLEWIQQEIFTKSCAGFSACHMGEARSAAGLNLEAGMAQAALVGQPSTLQPSYELVVPGDPQASYLMIILGHYDGPRRLTMPPGNPLLCEEKREAITRWIRSLDNSSAGDVVQAAEER